MTTVERAPAALELTSPHLRVGLSTAGGLRIAALARAGRDENLLGAFPDVVWQTPWGPYGFRGGHRLWAAPERQPDVAEPEPDPVADVDGPARARIRQATPSPSGLMRALEVELDSAAPQLTTRHTIGNGGSRALELAPWALTMLELGGVALVPHDPTPRGGAAYTPNRILVGWPYTSFADERLSLSPDLLAWRAEPGPAWKVGTFSNLGRIGYVRGDVLLEKRFVPLAGAVHADGGCNVEIYSDGRFAEIETLGPLVSLEPGMEVVHTERWLVHTLAGGGTPAHELAAALLLEGREAA